MFQRQDDIVIVILLSVYGIKMLILKMLTLVVSFSVAFELKLNEQFYMYMHNFKIIHYVSIHPKCANIRFCKILLLNAETI